GSARRAASPRYLHCSALASRAWQALGQRTTTTGSSPATVGVSPGGATQGNITSVYTTRYCIRVCPAGSARRAASPRYLHCSALASRAWQALGQRTMTTGSSPATVEVRPGGATQGNITSVYTTRYCIRVCPGTVTRWQ
ncbi:hypothetical protein PR003_g32042, partial [Phytophthora rubi]